MIMDGDLYVCLRIYDFLSARSRVFDSLRNLAFSQLSLYIMVIDVQCSVSTSISRIVYWLLISKIYHCACLPPEKERTHLSI